MTKNLMKRIVKPQKHSSSMAIVYSHGIFQGIVTRWQNFCLGIFNSMLTQALNTFSLHELSALKQAVSKLSDGHTFI